MLMTGCVVLVMSSCHNKDISNNVKQLSVKGQLARIKPLFHCWLEETAT